MTELEHLVSKACAAAAGGFGVLSTSEKLAAALILNRHDWLVEMDYTMVEAIARIGPEWMALIPDAAKAVEYSHAALRVAARTAREETTLSSYASDDTVDVCAQLVTSGESPGYRDVSLTLDIQRLGANAKHRICMRLSPEDGTNIAQHIISVHRFAWDDGDPLDVRDGERRPRWIG